MPKEKSKIQFESLSKHELADAIAALGDIQKKTAVQVIGTVEAKVLARAAEATPLRKRVVRGEIAGRKFEGVMKTKGVGMVPHKYRVNPRIINGIAREMVKVADPQQVHPGLEHYVLSAMEGNRDLDPVIRRLIREIPGSDEHKVL